MDPRRKAFVLFLAMVGLFGFHMWLLSRTVARGDLLLSGLLIVAVSLFSWRTVHYWSRFRGAPESPPSVDSPDERLRIRNWSLLLAGLLVLHTWLFVTVVSIGDVDVFLASGLALAMAVFVYRLIYYGFRYRQLRRAGETVEAAPRERPADDQSLRAASDQESEDAG
ncbi:MAG: hypothetical protein ACE5KQ_06640 [Thermoplasmata archaeon]